MKFTILIPDEFAERVPESAATSMQGVAKMISAALDAAEIPAVVLSE